MTLVVTMHGRESIWLLADRRLSYKGRAPKDDARKVMFLETQDGVAMLGYAGLGATAAGTEPADWMSAVLRGQNMPLEQSLAVLADALKRQLPRHMVGMPTFASPAHTVLVSAFLNEQARFYSLDLVLAPDRKRFNFRYTRHVSIAPASVTPAISIGGSGALYLNRNENWIRPLLHLLRAYDRGKIRSHVVADRLAKLNYEVHLGMTDKSVGPRCIVAWRNRKGGFYKGGGGHQFYTKEARDSNSPSLPTLANGMDVRAIVEVMTPRFLRMFDAMRNGKPEIEIDKDEINAEMARRPSEPNEYLR